MKAGYIALIGKPNVGKSTLVNRIVGQKVSIVSNKPQTTRRRVLGVAQGDGYQMALVDTPGVHDAHTRLGKTMLEHAKAALADVDAVLVVVDASHYPGEQDLEIAQMLKTGGISKVSQTKVILCLNKMDQLKAENVQRNLDGFLEIFPATEFMMTTATRGDNVDKLLELLLNVLPETSTPLFDEDTFTDQSSRFMAAEFIREKILIATRQEVPHATAVVVDNWEVSGNSTRIHATILVEKASQRGIIIGKQGSMLTKIGTEARKEIEAMVGTSVYLELHVKVDEDWRMNPRTIHELEYGSS